MEAGRERQRGGACRGSPEGAGLEEPPGQDLESRPDGAGLVAQGGRGHVVRTQPDLGKEGS